MRVRLLLALILGGAAAAAAAAAGGDDAANRLNTEQALAKCSAYSALYTNIDDDLQRWSADGISLTVMQQTIAQHTLRKAGQKGFAAGFWKGKAYLLDEPNLYGVGHHAQLLFIYMRLLLYLETTYSMPDVDFVINTIDRPLGLNLNASSSDAPVLRFCKTRSHADVLIPIFHFYMKDYDGTILNLVPQINEKYPWADKKDVVFGRFSLYFRHFHVDDPAVPPRLGAGGVSICNSSKTVRACAVRAHFVEWSKKNKDLDVSNGRRIAMADHARYKYLIHLDGQGLSSRMDQLLPLNSLVFKEESGYRTFYHHLLEPYKHYVPFWKERPEDILDVLQWAREHDDEARQIAAAGQQLAVKYLNKDARSCYWFTLLTRISTLLRYEPGRVAGRQYMESYLPVDEYLETVAKKFEGGKAWRSFVTKFTP